MESVVSCPSLIRKAELPKTISDVTTKNVFQFPDFPQKNFSKVKPATL